jgi:hypothetical protein
MRTGHAWWGGLVVALAGCSDSSGPPPMPAPSGLTASVEAARTRIDLTWVDNTSDEDGFLIERCLGLACTNFAQITSVPSNTITYQNTSLGEDTPYSYRVRAYNTADTSAYSNVATGTTASADFFVNAVTGSDANAGTNAAPFKTITKALSVADSGNVITVRPGRYDEANGEVFPLVVPDYVALIGDEFNKGGGATPTLILGGDTLTISFIAATIAPRAHSFIAGFTITDSAAVSGPMGVYIEYPSVTLRNNRIVNNGSAGIYVIGSTENHVITGNILSGNFVGLGFINGGGGSVVGFNTITGNQYGVEYDSPGGNLGDGITANTGFNVISCNTANDIWTNSTVTISAVNNFWDHVPPTTGAGIGIDFYNGQGTATLTATGAALASSPCT